MKGFPLRWPSAVGPEGKAGKEGERGERGEKGEQGPSGSSSLINVLEFGAKGDGITDDAKAIQEALNKGAESEGSTVFVPSGIFLIGTPLQIASHTSLSGVAPGLSVLRGKTGSNLASIMTSAEYGVKSVHNVYIQHLGIDGNATNNPTAEDGLKLDLVSSHISDCYIYDCPKVGIFQQQTSGDEELRPYGGPGGFVDNSIVWDCGSAGISWGGHDWCFTNCIAISNETSGFLFREPADACKVLQCHAYGTEEHAFTFESGYMRFVDCEAEGATVSNVEIKGDNFQWVGGELFRDSEGRGTAGFRWSKAGAATRGYNGIIQGVRCRNQTDGAFIFLEGCTADHTLINGTVFAEVGTAVSTAVGTVEPDPTVEFTVKLYGGVKSGTPLLGKTTVEAFKNGWKAVSTVRYWREGGTVYISGQIEGGVAGEVFTLPPGLRPPETITLPGGSVENTVITIEANGVVKRGGGAAMILGGISFGT